MASRFLLLGLLACAHSLENVKNYRTFICQDGNDMLDSSRVCDGIPNCKNAIDEDEAMCNQVRNITLEDGDLVSVSFDFKEADYAVDMQLCSEKSCHKVRLRGLDEQGNFDKTVYKDCNTRGGDCPTPDTNSQPKNTKGIEFSSTLIFFVERLSGNVSIWLLGHRTKGVTMPIEGDFRLRVRPCYWDGQDAQYGEVKRTCRSANTTCFKGRCIDAEDKCKSLCLNGTNDGNGGCSKGVERPKKVFDGDVITVEVDHRPEHGDVVFQLCENDSCSSMGVGSAANSSLTSRIFSECNGDRRQQEIDGSPFGWTNFPNGKLTFQVERRSNELAVWLHGHERDAVTMPVMPNHNQLRIMPLYRTSGMHVNFGEERTPATKVQVSDADETEVKISYMTAHGDVLFLLCTEGVYCNSVVVRSNTTNNSSLIYSELPQVCNASKKELKGDPFSEGQLVLRIQRQDGGLAVWRPGHKHEMIKIPSKEGESLKIRARNPALYMVVTVEITPDTSYRFYMYVAGGLICLLFVVVAVAAWQMKRERNLWIKGRELDPERSAFEQALKLPWDKNFEIELGQITIEDVIGTGVYGQVRKATVHNVVPGEATTTVAVKMVHDRNNPNNELAMKSLKAELKVMAHLGLHLNVVNLIGACTKDLKYLLVVVEYCKFGSLSNYLINQRDSFVDDIRANYGAEHRTRVPRPNAQQSGCCSSDLQKYALQIAHGMEFLSRRNVVHGDVAARNVLLAEGNIVKICNFGLSKIVHQKSNRPAGIKPPVKWMAPESLVKGTFSTSSDVWSYGVFLWELCSLGEMPYQGIRTDLLIELKNGYRMEKPRYATNEMYAAIQSCWDIEPCFRPTFKQLVEIMSTMVQLSDRQLYNEKIAIYESTNAQRRRISRYDDFLTACNPRIQLRNEYANTAEDTDA